MESRRFFFRSVKEESRRYHRINQIKLSVAWVFFWTAVAVLVILLTDTGDGVNTSAAPPPIPSTASAPPSIPSKKKASQVFFNETQEIIWLGLVLDMTQRSIEVGIQLLNDVLRVKKDLSVEDIQLLSMSLDLLKHGHEKTKWANTRFQNATGVPKVDFCNSFALLDRLLPLAKSDMQISMRNIHKLNRYDDYTWKLIWASLKKYIFQSIKDVTWSHSKVLEIGSSLDVVKCE